MNTMDRSEEDDDISEAGSDEFSDEVQLGFAEKMSSDEQNGDVLFNTSNWKLWDGGKIGKAIPSHSV